MSILRKINAKKNKRGFTLIELIVVIAIVGVLAAILVPTIMNVMSKARVASFNSTAKSIQRSINQMLLQADSAYYGIESGRVMTFDITVNESGGRDVWKCSAATSGAYNNNNRSGWQWGSAATYTAGDTLSSKSGEAMICSMLSEQYGNMKRASMVIVMYQGNCTFVAFTTDTGVELPESEYPPVTNGMPASTFAWNGKTPGMTPSNMIIGTAPVVDITI